MTLMSLLSAADKKLDEKFILFFRWKKNKRKISPFAFRSTTRIVRFDIWMPSILGQALNGMGCRDGPDGSWKSRAARGRRTDSVPPYWPLGIADLAYFIHLFTSLNKMKSWRFGSFEKKTKIWKKMAPKGAANQRRANDRAVMSNQRVHTESDRFVDCFFFASDLHIWPNQDNGNAWGWRKNFGTKSRPIDDEIFSINWPTNES